MQEKTWDMHVLMGVPGLTSDETKLTRDTVSATF